MKLARILPVVALLGVLLAGCVPAAPNIASPGVFPGGVPLTAQHTLAPGDEIELRFPYYTDLNDHVVVGPDGRLSLQLVNTVAVGGLTAEQATKLLDQRYAKVIRDPDLSVTVLTYSPEEVYVDGWVNTPGIVRSDLPLTMARAVAQAGGAKTGAKTDDVLLLRRGADGKIYYYRVALGGFAGAGPNAQDPMLQSYDVVYVPKTLLGSFSDFLASYVRNLPFYFNYPID